MARGLTIGHCSAAAVGSLVVCAWAALAQADEIRIIASPGVSAVLGQLTAGFEKATGHTLAIKYGLVPAQKQGIDSGEFDLAIVPSPGLDEGIKSGKIVADTRTELAQALLCVGVRSGIAKPDLSSIDAFRRAMLGAASVTYVVDEPAGKTITAGFKSLGIANEMKGKTKPHETVTQVWQSVASGEAELGFGFTSNALAVHGVEVAGSFPSELQYAVVMAAGIVASAPHAGAAESFIGYLRQPEAAAVFKAKGLEPAAER